MTTPRVSERRPVSSPTVGEVFAGRYELVDLIGHGGMGSVWRVFDHRERGFCAAKVLRQSDAATVLRFVREQSLRIQHPHVVAPKGWAAEDDRVLFTMDLVPGGSVATLLGDHGRLPSIYVAVLLDQLLDALHAVHAKGVVHRDVKPANVLLEATGRGRPFARLTDFGIAVQMNEPRLTSTGLVLGTPGYLAPEGWRAADPEPRQDLFSAGLMCAELVTGSRPTSDTQHFEDLGPAPPGVHEGLWSVLRRLSAGDPALRPASAAAARELLAGLRVGPAPLVPPPGVTAAWNPGPDPVEVFDQIGPLPAGWAPRGTPSPPAPHAPTTRVDPATRRLEAPPVSGPRSSAQRSSAPRVAPSWLRIAAAALVVGLTVGLAATQLPWPDGSSTSESGSGTGSGSGSSGIERAVQAGDGDECAWTDVGEQAVGTDDRTLTCERTENGGYRWTDRSN